MSVMRSTNVNDWNFIGDTLDEVTYSLPDIFDSIKNQLMLLKEKITKLIVNLSREHEDIESLSLKKSWLKCSNMAYERTAIFFKHYPDLLQKKGKTIANKYNKVKQTEVVKKTMLQNNLSDKKNVSKSLYISKV